MKCPKCGYLAFESGDRCRNCGYEFALAQSTATALDMTLDAEFQEPRPSLDLDRIIGAPEPDETATDLPLFSPAQPEPKPSSTRRSGHRARPDALAEDAPLITAPSQPRAPLGVRRATLEVPRARVSRRATPSADMLFGPPRVPPDADRFAANTPGRAADETALATPWRRIMAALVDVTLLSLLDAAVLYFTLRLCGLTTAEIVQLPVLPLIAFFLMLNGGYFIAFTTVGGQSIGKMALGIKVVAQEDGSVPIGRATVRTLAYLISALPLGAGFLPGVISADRLALHDRLAHTRVVRPSQT
jgi:uncharacterized RDD family membrane protein YckC